MISWDCKVYHSACSLSLWGGVFIITKSGRLAEIRESVCILKTQRRLYLSFSMRDSGLFIYHLFVFSNFNFLHNSLWIPLPMLSWLVLFSFFANSLQSLIVRLIVSSLSPYNLICCFAASYLFFALMWLVLIALFWAVIRRDSVSLLRFFLLRHSHVFSCELSLVSRLKHP